MKKHLFLLIDDDEMFVESMTAFLAVSGYAAIIDLKAFTSAGAAERMLQKSEGNALVIVAESIVRKEPGLEQVRRRVVLIDNDPGDLRKAELNSGEPIVLNKFQSLHRLFEMLCMYDEAWIQADRTTIDKSLKPTQVVAVYAAAGGAGKTTVALNMARALSSLRLKTLYLSLESLSAAHVLLGGEPIPHEDGRFSKLIYYLKTDPGKLQSRWDLFIDSESSTGLHYIAPVHAAREMNAMSGETAKQMIEVLAATNRYERLVIDLDSALQPRTIGALERSDDVIWIIQGDALTLYKTRSAFQLLPALRNVHWVANKHTGRRFPKDAGEGIQPVYFLPYVPEWKTADEPNVLLSHRLFTEAVGAMTASLFEHARPASSGTT